MRYLITILLLVAPMMATTWTFQEYTVNPEKTVVTFLALSSEGIELRIQLPRSKWGNCDTTSLNKVESCFSDRAFRWEARLNEKEALSNQLPTGPLVLELATPVTAPGPDGESQAKTALLDKINKLRGCIAERDLGLHDDTDCEVLRVAIDWVNLPSVGKQAVRGYLQ